MISRISDMLISRDVDRSAVAPFHIGSVWSSGEVPSEWKQACIILAHKKGDTANPANFRLITLEPVPLKVFTSCLRNSLYQFLLENKYIQSKIQKGFTPKISGTLEHTSQMANVINKARIKQRPLIIKLLDLPMPLVKSTNSYFLSSNVSPYSHPYKEPYSKS